MAKDKMGKNPFADKAPKAKANKVAGAKAKPMGKMPMMKPKGMPKGK